MKDHEKRELVSRLTNVAVEFHGAQQLRTRIAAEVLPAIESAVAEERKRWQRIASAAQSVTVDVVDKIDHFEVPSQTMAALALALDESTNAS